MFADGTDRLVQGNLVAAGLDAQSMQHIARWLNLSETTFALPPTEPGADYRLRIFTPANELPYAGHPTLGSAHAVVTAGLASPRSGTLVQQCGSGLIPREVDADDGGAHYRLRLPSARSARRLIAIAPAPAVRRNSRRM